MHILSRKEMKFYDNSTINNFKIPSRILMENAGKGCSDFIRNKYGDSVQKIIVFCGSGNNGGDGFVVARWLKNAGKQVVVIKLDKTKKMSESALAKIVKELNAIAEMIRTKQDEKQSVIKDLKHFHTKIG